MSGILGVSIPRGTADDQIPVWNSTLGVWEVQKLTNDQVDAAAAISQTKIAGGPTFSARRSTTQAIGTGSATKVQLDSEEWDSNSYYDAVTNFRFLPLVAGYYQINGAVGLDSLGSEISCYASIFKNGSEYRRGTLLFTSNTSQNLAPVVSSVVQFNGSTDYVELFVFHNHGSNRNTINDVNRVWFNGAFLRS